VERDPGVLLVAATEPELGGRPGLVCGVGPVEAAAAVAAALAVDRPAAVLHVGLAGGAELEVTTLVVGTEAVYLDLEAAIPVVERVAPDPALVAAARAALPSSAALPIGTSAAVGWHRGADPRAPRVEAMEGFAVLRACELAGVPAVEVRAVSNEIGEQDRGRWELERALEALAAAIPRLLAALRER
jgi:predicted 5'-methylthioadenosine/S-adenosylhomocysteine nucleosidase